MPYMQRLLLGFCGGGLLLGLPWPGEASLPRWMALSALLGLAAAPALAALRWALPGGPGALPAWAGIMLGLTWSGVFHDAALRARLADPGSGDSVVVTGRVVGDPVPIASGGGVPAQRFQALLTSQRGGAGSDVTGARVRLSWYGGPPVANGEQWAWTTVLKEPWSYANPGGFDYERWLLGAGIQGTGYVRGGERLAEAPPGLLGRARAALVALVSTLDLANGGVLLALLLGRSTGISDGQWEILRATGTVHLMVISGLHVSLAAALGYAVGRGLARLIPLLPLWLDVRAAGCLTGAAVAVAYVMLAGAGLPALRALIMSAATLTLLAGGRTGRVGCGLLLALAVLLAIEPLSVHQQGFWLSFGAVGILYLTFGHRLGGARVRALLVAQLALSVGMLPLVAMATATLPWTGVPANLLAVPVISLAVVPATLLAGALAAVSATAAGWLLVLADTLAGGVLCWLGWLALAPLPVAGGGGFGLPLAQAGALCWLVGMPRWYLPALALCWALLLAAPGTGLAPGEYRVIALDVGQGTAVVIDTVGHRLLYDAGPAFPSGFETGSAVVIPSLAATGPARLDLMILSHDDIDHVGGADRVRAAVSPGAVLASAGDGSTQECHGRRWRWDGVSFRMLRIERAEEAPDNDRSCILLVDDGRHRTLIAGDVSTRVEAKLLKVLAPDDLPVHLLFAPHHGSATSSSTALVRVLRPRLVLVTAGRDNRFGHPHPEVVARYRRVGARLYETGREGALVWRSSSPDRLTCWRRDHAPYWRGRDGRSCRPRRDLDDPAVITGVAPP
jgi:competence protein ComEC